MLGFNYNFDSLDATYNEFDEAFTTMNEAALTPRLLPLLRVWFPLLRLFVSTMIIPFVVRIRIYHFCHSPLTRVKSGMRNA